MTATMVSRLIDAAELLLREGRLSGAFRRRAVSTAYYAVFHRLAKLCAETLLSDEKSDDYIKIYRALDHGPLKHTFQAEPLRSNDTLRNIGNLVATLQNERHKADYLPPTTGVFRTADARKLIDQSKDVISQIDALAAADRQTLAVHLLFKTRSP